MGSNISDIVKQLLDGMHTMSKTETIIGEPIRTKDANRMIRESHLRPKTVILFTHKTYLDPSGKVQVETYEVPGMSHGVAVDPKGGCGKAGAFVLDTGLCSSKLAADFFGI